MPTSFGPVDLLLNATPAPIAAATIRSIRPVALILLNFLLPASSPCTMALAAHNPWISSHVWKGARRVYDWRDLLGRKAYGGLDLSSTTDRMEQALAM